MLKYVPNILTICRFILIPFIVYSIITGNFILAFILYSLSGITDILDGMIARKYNLISNFGKLIDPLADKATQISVILVLTTRQIIPNYWILGILMAKELIMIIGASFLYGKELVVSSKWYGKLSTVLIYLAIVSSFAISIFNLSFKFDIYLYYLALISLVFSFIMYFKAFVADNYLKNIIKK
ncbi:MAG: CDP-alcohol phosphatidyltransferase family protein [Clostridia bacterium]|nr:CDP-alcohol phosphatidyltransferase family protein [Clostridia bacterium]